jgi:hypothetical protein
MIRPQVFFAQRVDFKKWALLTGVFVNTPYIFIGNDDVRQYLIVDKVMASVIGHRLIDHRPN